MFLAKGIMLLLDYTSAAAALASMLPLPASSGVLCWCGCDTNKPSEEPSTGVLIKRCSENMQNFIEITLRHRCSPVSENIFLGTPLESSF